MGAIKREFVENFPKEQFNPQIPSPRQATILPQPEKKTLKSPPRETLHVGTPFHKAKMEVLAKNGSFIENMLNMETPAPFCLVTKMNMVASKEAGTWSGDK